MERVTGVSRVSDLGKKIVIGSGVVAAIVMIAAILDLVSQQFPFGGAMFLDIVFIIAAAMIGYMCYDTLSEVK